jgi:DNA repair ATPase RecN
MPVYSLSEIKKELKYLTPDELRELCARLGRFKAENKILMTYELFYKEQEETFVEHIKEELSDSFSNINTNSYFYMKKTIRKILKQIRLFSRLSRSKSTEIELLLFFCEELNQLNPSIHNNKMLGNLYRRQIEHMNKRLNSLHPDLQYDYRKMIEELKSPLK